MLQGDKYSAEDGDLYFNSKTGTLDDVYGDYAFAQPAQHSSCKLGPTGAPILDGDKSGHAPDHFTHVLLCCKSGKVLAVELPAVVSGWTFTFACKPRSLPYSGAYKGMCDLQLTGANKLVPLLHGGLDGIYKLHTCESGRPAFKRTTGPENGEHGDTDGRQSQPWITTSSRS
jgi:hypothetical protein